MVAETSELRSGITSAFNKRLNEALQFNPQMAFNIENTVTPTQTIAVLKGEQGTPGLPAAISAVKDNNNLIMLAVSPIERGKLKLLSNTTGLYGGTGAKTIVYTVPEGQKWLIKGYTIDQAGIATTTYDLLLNIDGKDIRITSSIAIILTYFTIPLLLEPGSTLTYTFNVSADTSGNGRGRLLYQEITI